MYPSSITALSLLVLSVLVGNAHAEYVYRYTGNPFDTFRDTVIIDGSYDPSHSLVIELVFDGPLGPIIESTNPLEISTVGNLFTGSVSPTLTSFSATDGRSWINNSNFSGVPSYTFELSSAGVIVGWDIFFWPIPAEAGERHLFVRTRKDTFTRNGRDRGSISECDNSSASICNLFVWEFGEVLDNPGEWTITVVPIPQAIWLLLIPLHLLLKWRGKTVL